MPSPFDPNLLFKRIRSKGVSEWQDTINKKLRNAIVDLMTKSNEIITNVEVTSFKRVAMTGTQDGVNTVFTLAYALKEDSEQIFIDGVFLSNKDNCDYTLSETNLTFSFSPYDSDKITIFGIKE